MYSGTAKYSSSRELVSKVSSVLGEPFVSARYTLITTISLAAVLLSASFLTALREKFAPATYGSSLRANVCPCDRSPTRRTKAAVYYVSYRSNFSREFSSERSHTRAPLAHTPAFATCCLYAIRQKRSSFD